MLFLLNYSLINILITNFQVYIAPIPILFFSEAPFTALLVERISDITVAQGMLGQGPIRDLEQMMGAHPTMQEYSGLKHVSLTSNSAS